MSVFRFISIIVSKATLIALCWGNLVSAQETKQVPTVDAIYPNFVYPSEPCTFTRQHFNQMHVYAWIGGFTDSATLSRGKYERGGTVEEGPTEVELASFQVVNGTSTNPMFAVVTYQWIWIGGSSSQSDVVQVFGCKNDHLIVLQQISNDAHSQHAGATFDPKTGALMIRSVRYGAGAHGSPQELDIVNFQWAGNRFK